MHEGHAVQCDHVMWLVILACTISVLGAYCALRMAEQIRRATGRLVGGWIAGASIAMGGGAIWSMHFISMIACRLPLPVTYDVSLTIASLLISIVVSGIGLYVVTRRARNLGWLVAGGTFMGLGIVAMHYTGMAAMRVSADATYRPEFVVASILIAIVAAIAALRICFQHQGGWQRGGSSVVMGAAVCGMHYTAMAGVTFTPTATIVDSTSATLDSSELGLIVFVITLIVLGSLAMASTIVGHAQAKEMVRRTHGELELLVAERTAELAKINAELQAENVERRHIESALHESEARYRGIIETALDAVVTIDETGVITAWNAQAATTFGWSATRAIGRSLADTIIPVRLREAHKAGLRHYLATGEGPVLGKRIEITAVNCTGHEFPVELAISTIRSGGNVAFSAFIRDITESKQTARTLEQQRTFLRQVIDTNPNLIFAKNRAGRFTLVNKAVADAYGTSVDELIGKTDADFNPNKAEVEFFLAADREVIDTLREKFIPEEKITDSTGKLRWLQTVKRPIIGDEGRATQVLGVATDITERKALEAQFRQAQKMEAVGTLAGGVAHDFNNLLTVILTYCELLVDAMGADNPLVPDVEEIQKASVRAVSLTRQLLAFSRKQVVELKILDLNAIVTDMDSMLRRLIGEAIEAVTLTDPTLGRIRSDRGQMEQVVMNLVVNAAEAMPRGGKLTIESRNVELATVEVREHFKIEPGRYVMLAVRDSGIGMDAETRARIFEPFFTTKEVGKGTGLGLSTVYGIVKQNSGYIWVDSEPGRGASFTIYLPHVDDELDRTISLDRSRPVSGTETILLVEDEDALRSLTTRVLGREGYTVVEARNGEDALRVVAASDRPIELVLTDCVMPGMPVGDLVVRLRSIRPRAKWLLMSGYTNEAIVSNAIMASELPFLEKPFTAAVLLRKVRDVLDAQVATAPSLDDRGSTRPAI